MAMNRHPEPLPVPTHAKPALAVFEKDVLSANWITEAAKGAAFGGVFGAGYAVAFGWWIKSTPSIVRRELKYKTSLGAGIAGAYMATSILTAQIRGKDDFWNEGAGGLVAGALLGLARKNLTGAIGHSLLLGAIMTGTSWNLREHEINSRYRYEDRQFIKGEHFYAWPKPDPFAARIEEIKARDASASE
eukprot:jgi/Hompol1/4984/HPOL_004107-RA